MLCARPFRKGVMEYGCGQCMPCRINRSRLWVGRMTLEAAEHPYSAFVTLTFNPENVPSDGSVHKEDLQNFLKRLRKLLHPRLIRYYGVGEYGDQSWRPHYHLVVFGLSPTEGEVVQKAWSKDGKPLGFIQCGTAEPKSMSYVASYVTKKMTNPKDKRLDGRYPEFAIMSKGCKKIGTGGIGFGVVKRIKKAYQTEPGRIVLEKKTLDPTG